MTKLNPFDLRHARLTAGVTLAEAGEAIGVSESFVAHVEASRRHLSPDQSARLREFLAAALRRRAEKAAALAKTITAA